ncbi:hypothetical protein H2509_04855 [Stappia sp. F7233]|uniref:Uncharacterized protein n=1 Tax=Stappia albiluteola TaxID=2758565 RepID=A0A839ABT1_9HYPH|nr:hypothetical protein [Stappia albiluteola]MBA5776454.1 hypothetical protein [Stappia albiluteola]
MAPRRSSSPLDFDRDTLLGTMKSARDELVQARRGMQKRSGLMHCVDAVIEDLDELALVLTGRRDYFHAGGHATLPGERTIGK